MTPRAAVILGLTVGAVAIAAATAIAMRAAWAVGPIMLLLLGGIGWATRADRRMPDPLPDPSVVPAESEQAHAAGTIGSLLHPRAMSGQSAVVTRSGMERVLGLRHTPDPEVCADEARAKRYYDGLGDPS